MHQQSPAALRGNPGSYLFRGAVAQPTTPARRCLLSFRADPHQRTGNQTRTGAIRGTRTPRSPVSATGTFALLERKDAFPVVLHADDGPALLLCFVVEGLRESADFRVAQSLRRAVGVFAFLSSCSTSIINRAPSPAPV